MDLDRARIGHSHFLAVSRAGFTGIVILSFWRHSGLSVVRTKVIGRLDTRLDLNDQRRPTPNQPLSTTTMTRCLSLARNVVQRTSAHARHLSTSPILRNDAAPSPNLGTVSSPKKPIGGFRGGFGFRIARISLGCTNTICLIGRIIGFLFGFSLASSYAAYHLLDEYKAASAALQASVEELQASTAKVTAQVRRIEAVEKDLKALSQSSASKDDLSRVRAEMKKLYDGLHIGMFSFLIYWLSLRIVAHRIP